MPGAVEMVPPELTVSVSVWMTKMPGQLPSTLIHRNNIGLEAF